MTTTDFDPNTTEVDLVDSTEKAFTFLRWLSDVRTPIIGIDVETDGFNWFDGRLRLVQFGTFNSGWGIPYEEYPALVKEAMDIVDARKLPITGHNFVHFDAHWLEQNVGWTIKNWNLIHDSLPLASVIESTGPKALKDLSTIMVHPAAAYGQAVLHEAMTTNGWTWGTVPTHFPPYWVYGVMDTILAVHLLAVLRRKAAEAGCLEAYEIERGAFPGLYAMERRGLLVDGDHVRAQELIIRQRLEEIDAEVFNFGITNMNSTDQITRAMIEAGIELTATTETGRWKMDKDTLDVLSVTVDHPLMALITEYRRSSKYLSAYYENFLRFQRSDGRVHPQYRQTQARTGRMSATDPAIQTVPRAEKDPNVRNSFIVPDGHRIISTDFTNIEARIFAHFAQEEPMLQTIRAGVDLHGFTAQRIYNEAEIVPKSDVRRQIAKSVLFTLLFGGGPEKMLITANEDLPKGWPKVTLPEIHEARDGLFLAFPGIKIFQRQIQDMAVENLENTGRAFIRGIDGRILMMSENDDRYYAFTNWLIQSSATILLKQRLAVCHAMDLDQYFTAAIHDEILAEVPTEDCEDYSIAIAEAMNDLTQFSVPITADPGKPAQRLGDAK